MNRFERNANVWATGVYTAENSIIVLYNRNLYEWLWTLSIGFLILNLYLFTRYACNTEFVFVKKIH